MPTKGDTFLDFSWKPIYWRFLRGVVATALAQAIVIKIDYTKPKETLSALGVAFIVGVLTALSKALRDNVQDGSIAEKLPI